MFLALLLPSPAVACGGMFCDTLQPVDQAAERIVFGWEPDDDGGVVTTHVQITYEGEADDFAWVVPVPAEPELFVSNDAVFTTLANATIPTYPLQFESKGSCRTLSKESSADTGAIDFSSSDAASEGVQVIAEETVGPYETVILQATDEDVLISWLRDQGYGIPENISPVVAPYVASNQFFVALRLGSDKSTGDLTPLGMRYRGDASSIPITLTSVAAVPDLPIQVFVLGPSRAVPDNYLHVRINEAAIDWYAGGTNYRDVVKRAADEAGGQAFATDYAGSASMFDQRLWADWMIETDGLAEMSNPISWLEQIVFSSLPPSAQLTALLLRYVPAPDGVDPTAFLSCPSCYEYESDGFDPAVATAALEAEILVPLADAQAMVDGAPMLTRMFTTMDAAEMTVDPIFVFNDDVEQDLPTTHIATSMEPCNGRGDRTLVLEDGREIELPSEESLEDMGMTELEYMAELTSPAAIIIEDLGAEGEGTMLFDYREQAAEDAKKFNGCGCASTGAAAPGIAGILAGLLIRRRRV